MTHVTVRIEKAGSVTKHPSVIIPLKDWGKIEDLLEDLEALSSPRFLQSIERARAELHRGKGIPFENILKEFA